MPNSIKTLPKPRKASREELAQLSEWSKEHISPDDTELAMATAYIAVFDYQTFYPGFVGKIMLVVWGLAPSAYQLFHWGNKLAHADKNSGKIRPLNQLADFLVKGADQWE